MEMAVAAILFFIAYCAPSFALLCFVTTTWYAVTLAALLSSVLTAFVFVRMRIGTPASYDRHGSVYHYLEDVSERLMLTLLGPVAFLGEQIDLQVNRRRVVLPPCFKLATLAQFLMSEKAYAKIYAQQIADVQVEYIQAVVAGHNWKAKWIRLRGVANFWWTAFFHAFDSTAGRLTRSFLNIR